MKCINFGGSYIEKTLTQESIDGYWYKFKNTKVKYKPENIEVQNTSTKTKLVFFNKNAIGNNINIITRSIMGEESHQIFIDKNKVTLGDYNFKHITKISETKISGKDSDGFYGSSLSISGDGLTALVGSCFDSTENYDQNGQVYIYKRTSKDDTWTEVNKLTASDKADGDYFGSSVAITSDGLVTMIGAIYKDTNNLTDNGQVYTYTTNIPA